MDTNQVEKVFAVELQTAMLCLGPASDVFSEAVENAVAAGLTRARCWALVQCVIIASRIERLNDLTRSVRANSGVEEAIYSCRAAGCNQDEINNAIEAGHFPAASTADELAMVIV